MNICVYIYPKYSLLSLYSIIPVGVFRADILVLELIHVLICGILQSIW